MKDSFYKYFKIQKICNEENILQNFPKVIQEVPRPVVLLQQLMVVGFFWFESTVYTSGQKPLKGQLISKWPFAVIVLTKIPTKFLKRGWIKKKIKALYFFLNYRKVGSSNTSCLEAHAGLFRLLMKGFFIFMYKTSPKGFMASKWDVGS